MYDQFRDQEVSFTRPVAQVLGLLAREVHLKCQGEIIPCVIFSSSMSAAKVVTSLRAESVARLRQANDLVSLRFCLARSERPEPLAFFVPARVSGRAFYDPGNPERQLLSLEFTQRPPDDLIERLGELLEANANASRRREARVDIHPATVKALGLEGKEAVLRIGGSPRNCILRDLSFSGARVLLFGASAQMVGAPVVLEPRFGTGSVALPGTVLRHEEVAGREDIGAVAIRFDDAQVPLGYKLALNGYLRSHPPAPAHHDGPQPPQPPRPPAP